MTKHPCYQIRMYQKRISYISFFDQCNTSKMNISYISSLIAKTDTTTKRKTIIVLRPDIFVPRQNPSWETSHLQPLGIMSQQILRITRDSFRRKSSKSRSISEPQRLLFGQQNRRGYSYTPNCHEKNPENSTQNKTQNRIVASKASSLSFHTQ